jgi:S-DNA-T family DNA segregation ATPase FtsK/SpoIIIE
MKGKRAAVRLLAASTLVALPVLPALADGPQPYAPPVILVSSSAFGPVSVSHDISPQTLDLGSQSASVTVQAQSQGSGRNGGGMGCQFSWSLDGVAPGPPATGFIGGDAGAGSFPQTFSLAYPHTLRLSLDCAPGVPQGQALPDPGMALTKGYVSVTIRTEAPAPSPSASIAPTSAPVKPAVPRPTAPKPPVPPVRAVVVEPVATLSPALTPSVSSTSAAALVPSLSPAPASPKPSPSTLAEKSLSTRAGPGFPWAWAGLGLTGLVVVSAFALRRLTGAGSLG